MVDYVQELLIWQDENSSTELKSDFSAPDLFPEEQAELYELFRGKDFDEIQVCDLSCKDYICSRMSESAFFCYLPRFLYLAVYHEEELDVFVDSLIAMLNPPLTGGEPRSDWKSNIESNLGHEKRRIVSQFLADQSDKCYECAEAIDKYWGKYLPG